MDDKCETLIEAVKGFLEDYRFTDPGLAKPSFHNLRIVYYELTGDYIFRESGGKSDCEDCQKGIQHTHCPKRGASYTGEHGCDD